MAHAEGRPQRTRGAARLRPLFASLLLLWLPASARATWSIVAVDPETREVGIAGASCISGADVIAGVVPNRGVVAAQAYTSFRGRDRAVELLRRGRSPTEIVETLRSSEFDRWGVPLHRLRQYGVAALGHDARAVTGRWNNDWAGDTQWNEASVQGNMLYGREVVTGAMSAYREATAGGRPLAERLLLALEAGAAAGGDQRCPRARAALSAFLIVARPDDEPDGPGLSLRVPDRPRPGAIAVVREQLGLWWRRRDPGFADAPLGDGAVNPVAALRSRYDAQRDEREAGLASPGSPPGRPDR